MYRSLPLSTNQPVKALEASLMSRSAQFSGPSVKFSKIARARFSFGSALRLVSALNHNPVLLLKEYSPDKLEQRARETVMHSRINWAYRRWLEYMQSDETWGATHAGLLGHRPVAYFSAEFGIHESLPIYSGGLGVLSGDHLKSASDLGVPLVGEERRDGDPGEDQRRPRPAAHAERAADEVGDTDRHERGEEGDGRCRIDRPDHVGYLGGLTAR